MAQPHLGDRVQIRYYAPKVIVDALMTEAARPDGLPFSQVVSALLTELTGFAQQGSLFPMPCPTAFSRDPNPGAVESLKCRVPSQVEKRLNAMAGEEGIPPGPGAQARNRMITRLLARRLGYIIDQETGSSSAGQLTLTGHEDEKNTLAAAS